MKKRNWNSKRQVRAYINSWKRTCRNVKAENRIKKAWRVPGTKEHGELNMLEVSLRNCKED